MPLSSVFSGIFSRRGGGTADEKESPAAGNSSTVWRNKSSDREDCSTLVLRHVQPPSAEAAKVLVQNYASSIVAWSDVFDVHAVPCDAWWLRGACADDGSELCVGDVDQLRTMSGRLARAAALAGSGSKWGLLQAVLLSWDSVPASAQSWVRQQIALEACGLLILPAAAEGLQAGLKAAWQALPGKEQQLWCQLQQARLMHTRRGLRPGGVDHYTVDRPAIAALLKCATGMEEAGALLAEPALEQNLDDVAGKVLSLATVRRSSMDASYTYLLQCCRVFGTSHPRTREALEDTRVTDPQGWVPLLLAGLAYPSLTRGPGVMKGSKEEATAYAATYGPDWRSPLPEMPSPEVLLSPGFQSLFEESTSAYGPHLVWMLQQRGIEVPPRLVQVELRELRWVNYGLYAPAYDRAHEVTSHPGRGVMDRVQQVGLACYVRACLVVVTSLFHLTYNLPPLDVAPQLWGPVAVMLGVPSMQQDLEALRTYLCAVFEHHYKAPAHLLMRNRTPYDGFRSPSEAEDMKTFLTTTQAMGCRLYWQLGYLGLAGAVTATIAGQRGHVAAIRDQMAARPGMDPNSPQVQAYNEAMQLVGDIDAWSAVCAVLGEQRQAITATAPRAAGGRGSQNQRGRASGSRAAGRGRAHARSHLCKVEIDELKFFDDHEHVSYARDPLFDRFPGWVDQLVSQVVGRKVQLAISADPAGDAPYPTGPMSGHAEVYLVEADGSKVPFSWRTGPGGSSSTSSSSNRSSSHPLSSGPPFDCPSAEQDYTMEVCERYLLPDAASAVPQAQAARGAAQGTAPVGGSRGGPGAGDTTSSGSTEAAGAGAAPKKGFSFKAALGGSSSSGTGAPAAAGDSSSRAAGTNSSSCSGSSGDSRPAPRSGRPSGPLQELANRHGFNVARVTDLRGLSLKDMEKAMYEHMAAVREEADGNDNSAPGRGRRAASASNPSRQQTAEGPASSRSRTQTARPGASRTPPAAMQGASSAAGTTGGGSSSRSASGQQGGGTRGSQPSPGSTQTGPAAQGPASHPISAAGEGSAEAPGGTKEPRPCAMCGQLFTKLRRCSQCKKVSYCCREHQVAHWKEVHKHECQGQP